MSLELVNSPVIKCYYLQEMLVSLLVLLGGTY